MGYPPNVGIKRNSNDTPHSEGTRAFDDSRDRRERGVNP